MTDVELVKKKLAVLNTSVTQLRTLAQPERLAVDVREERFVEHTLQIAIQAALDVAAHIVSDEQLGEPQEYRDLFTLVRGRVSLSDELSRRLRQMVGFRNVLVHGYENVNLDIVRDILSNRLGDLLEFARAVAEYLEAGSSPPKAQDNGGEH
jgi:uncharacterized protein YutE (UPF0331/DUF86 family)